MKMSTLIKILEREQEKKAEARAFLETVHKHMQTHSETYNYGSLIEEETPKDFMEKAIALLKD